MLTFEFVLSYDPNKATMSGLLMGVFRVSGDHGECFSSGDGTSMLVPSVCDLLNGLLAFLSSESNKQYVFSTPDGAFGMKFMKKKSGPLSIYCIGTGTMIATADLADLVKAMWVATQRLYSEYSTTIVARQDDSNFGWFENDIIEMFSAEINRWRIAYPDLCK